MSEEKEQRARINALIKGEVPVELAKGKLVMLIISWVIFIGIGIFALLDLLGPQWGIIMGILDLTFDFAALAIPLILLIVIASAMIVLTVWLMIRLLRKHGYSLLKFSIIFFVAMNWIVVIIIIILVGWTPELFFAMILPIVGTIMAILYFTIWKSRLELAGSILTITGQVTHEEKELFIPGYLKTFFVGILAGFGSIMAADLFTHMSEAFGGEVLWWMWVVIVLFMFLIFLYIYINTYFFNAITIAITYIWYRKKDPIFHDGLAIATYQLGDIAVFAAFSAIIKVIRWILQQLARKSKGKAPWIGGGYRLADGIIGTVWFYVNYFTLPAIVVEDIKATTAIKRSAHRLFDNWVDVLLKEWGVGSVFSMLSFLIATLFALAGAGFGALMWVMFPTALIDAMTWLIILIVIGVIIFIVLSLLVSKPLLNLLNDVYLTFLYGFVIDKETSFKHPNNLPEEMNGKLKEWFGAHPPVRRCQECFSKVPDGATSCPKCGAPYP